MLFCRKSDDRLGLVPHDDPVGEYITPKGHDTIGLEQATMKINR